MLAGAQALGVVDRHPGEVDAEGRFRVGGLQAHVEAAVAVRDEAQEFTADHHFPAAESPGGRVRVLVVSLYQFLRSDRHRAPRMFVGIDVEDLGGPGEFARDPEREEEGGGADEDRLAVALQLLGRAFARAAQPAFAQARVGRRPAIRAEFP